MLQFPLFLGDQKNYFYTFGKALPDSSIRDTDSPVLEGKEY